MPRVERNPAAALRLDSAARLFGGRCRGEAPSSGAQFFLALSPDLTLVRYVQMPEPVRLLHRAAAAHSGHGVQPHRPGTAGCCPRKRQNLTGSLRQRLVDARDGGIDWAPRNTLESLISMLGRRDYHIFTLWDMASYSGDGDDLFRLPHV